MAVTYFGYCDSSGAFAGSDNLNANDEIWWATAGYACPGAGNQTLVSMAINGYYNSGASNVLMAIYVGTELVAEGNAEKATAGVTTTYEWTAGSSELTWRNGHTCLVGGTTYKIAVTCDASTNFKGSTDRPSGTHSYASGDYTAGMPDPLPAASTYTYEVNTRVGVEPAAGDAGIYAGEVGLGLVPNSPVADLWSDTLLKWCDEGESSIGDVYLRAQAQPDFYLGLYTNSTEPAEDAAMAGISEPSGDYGYARVQLADGDWSETSQGTFTNLQKTFTCATSGWGDVYGWFITTAATGIGGKLITVEHFSDGPYPINVSDIVKVTPKLTFT